MTSFQRIYEFGSLNLFKDVIQGLRQVLKPHINTTQAGINFACTDCACNINFFVEPRLQILFSSCVFDETKIEHKQQIQGMYATLQALYIAGTLGDPS